MSDIIVKKDGIDYPLQTMPLHYPADRVYLDGDINKTVQDLKTSAYLVTLKNGWTGYFLVNVSLDNQITGISGYLDGTNATSDTFADASINLSDCITNHKLPVSTQASLIKFNQTDNNYITFVNSGSTWTANSELRTLFALNNIYMKSDA